MAETMRSPKDADGTDLKSPGSQCQWGDPKATPVPTTEGEITSLFDCLAPNLPNLTRSQAFLCNVNCKTNLIKGREKGQDAKSLLGSLWKGGAPRVRGQGLGEMEARLILLAWHFQHGSHNGLCKVPLAASCCFPPFPPPACTES